MLVCFVFNDLDSSRAGYLGSLIGVRLGCSVARRTGCRALLGAGGALSAPLRVAAAPSDHLVNEAWAALRCGGRAASSPVNLERGPQMPRLCAAPLAACTSRPERVIRRFYFLCHGEVSVSTP